MVGERLGVARGDLAPAPHDLRQSAELHDADGRLQVGHPVVEADLEVLLGRSEHAGVTVVRRDAHRVFAQPPRALGPVRVRGGEHPALAGREELAGVE